MKLRLHVGRELLPEGVYATPMVEPFLGVARWDPEGNWGRVSAAYGRLAGEWFEVAGSLAEAHAAVFPCDWGEVEEGRVDRGAAERFLRESGEAGKPAVVFYCRDAPGEFAWPDHAVVYRIAVRRSRRKPGEWIIPQWSRDDLAEFHGGVVRVRAKGGEPVVGFCGFAPPLGMAWGARRARETVRLLAHRCGLWRVWPDRMAHAARARALVALGRARGVRTAYRLRGESAFDNPVGAFLPGGSVGAASVRRREFAENVMAGDYVLCARGWANCSLRFYEALALGRIPLLVDTESVLPWDDAIAWGRYGPIVPESSLGEIGERLRRFHAALSPERFEALQRECRALYEEWLSPEGFFREVGRRLAMRAGFAFWSGAGR